jgi:hypothetical protein
MSDLTQHSTNRTLFEPDPALHAEAWRARANPDEDYSGGSGGEETPQPKGDQDQPVDPPPVAELDYSGGSGGQEPPPPTGDQDQPGDPPPPEVAETNGR